MPRNSDPIGRGRRPVPSGAAAGSRDRSARQTGSSGFQWTDDDFRSFETRAPRTGGSNDRSSARNRPREKRPRPSQSQQKRRPTPDRRRGSSRPANPDRRGAPETKKKKRKRRRIPRGLRHFLIVAGFLLTLAVTVLVAVTLVFKVDTITVTGSTVYSDAEIAGICDYHMGDSLFFLSTTDKEEKLRTELPYVEQAKITRKIPGTVQIDITTVKVAASISYEGQYIYIDNTGKMVEQNPAAAGGTILIKGLELSPPVLGKRFQAADTNKQTAYEEIMTQIIDSGAAEEITQIDIKDIFDIRLLYQNRVELLMGNAADLAYKLRFALSAVRDTSKISASAQGSLDLTLAKETNKAIWNADYSGSYGGTVNTPGTGESFTYEPFANNPGRGGDIPNAPYTGVSSDTNGESSDSSEGSSGEDSGGEDSEQTDEGGSSDEDNGNEEGSEDENGG